MNDDILNGLSDGTFRAHWLREVLRTSQITESVKVLLFTLAIEEMDAAGRVSVPRQEMAARIGRSKARVSERIQDAVGGGFLVRVSAGKKGSTAVYAAALKGSACADPMEGESDPGKGPDRRTEKKGPDRRTRTIFGSDLQDAKNNDEVRIGEPNDPKKGPPMRDANREGGEGGVELPPHLTHKDSLKMESAASRRPPQKPKSAKPPTAKHPLPVDFAVDDAMRAWAAETCPLVDVTIQTQLFINYFVDKPEIKRLGWVRSWKSWMLRQQDWSSERAKSSRPRPTGGSRSTTDERVEAAYALARELAQEAQANATNPPEITR